MESALLRFAKVTRYSGLNFQSSDIDRIAGYILSEMKDINIMYPGKQSLKDLNDEEKKKLHDVVNEQLVHWSELQKQEFINTEQGVKLIPEGYQVIIHSASWLNKEVDFSFIPYSREYYCVITNNKYLVSIEQYTDVTESSIVAFQSVVLNQGEWIWSIGIDANKSVIKNVSFRNNRL